MKLREASQPRKQIAGILLAAGRGSRFDASGRENKLLQRLPDGYPVAVRAARTLRQVLTQVVAVIRPQQHTLSEELMSAGCSVQVCDSSDQGLSVSIAYGLTGSSDAAGWIIALGDMPFVRPDTINKIAMALCEGAGIAAPFHHGRRGNPVGFSRLHLPDLLALQGDTGAACLLKAHRVKQIPVDDTGIFQDIDTVDDLRTVTASPILSVFPGSTRMKA